MSVRVTLSQLEEMINKAKQNNDQKLLARLSRIYIKRRSEEEQKKDKSLLNIRHSVLTHKKQKNNYMVLLSNH